MALPVKQAARLAEDMAKKGISGSISMGKPRHMGSGDMMDESPEKESEDPEYAELKQIADDVWADVKADDKEMFCQHLIELIERVSVKEEEEESPEEEMEEEGEHSSPEY